MEHHTITSTMTLEECKALCTVSWGGVVPAQPCEGVTVQKSGNGVFCWRRNLINLTACDDGTASAGYDTWLWSPTSQAKKPAVHWSQHRGLNCWEGHGAVDLELEKGMFFAEITFAECKAACDMNAKCNGIVFAPLPDPFPSEQTPRYWGRCFRRGSMDISKCDRPEGPTEEIAMDTWVKSEAPFPKPTEDRDCHPLDNHDCARNSLCRWCSIPGLDMSTTSGCLNQSYADTFVDAFNCMPPVNAVDPCFGSDLVYCPSSYKPECKRCFNTEGHGAPTSTCEAEVPISFPGYCEDDGAHHDAYKAACSQLEHSTCSRHPLCHLCQVAGIDAPLCVDKDFAPLACSSSSAHVSSLMV